MFEWLKVHPEGHIHLKIENDRVHVSLCVPYEWLHIGNFENMDEVNKWAKEMLIYETNWPGQGN
jgi:hypothetical protein